MTRHQRDVRQSLQRVTNNLLQTEAVPLKDLKLIIFSDHHRGKNDNADDFRPCKSAYHTALYYYLESGFTLLLLGDVEELWECRPEEVIETYRDTLLLEQKFAELHRYHRIWGNHDDHWQFPGEVTRYLSRFISAEIPVSDLGEGYALTVTTKGKVLGELLFVHGHQGTLESDKFTGISRLLVRYLWRPLQRLTGVKPPTPARDFKLRLKQEIALHAWANQHSSLILISGHTHHPVFSSLSHEGRIKIEIEDLEQRLEKIKSINTRKKLQAAIGEKTARLSELLARSNGISLDIPPDQKPCYFNTGCCSYSDGDITGIEIENGQIRLVRWPDDEGNQQRKVLQEDDLKKIFRLCL